MAERRMFSKTIIDSDAFLDMPLTTQSLYFHLSMRGDDEGFINNPKKIMRMIGATEDEFKILLAKNFVINFESGVVAIKHWKMHNYIRKDRVTNTVYREERSMLEVDQNGVYILREDISAMPIDNQETAKENTQKELCPSHGSHMSGTCQPDDSVDADKCQHRLGKVRLGEVRLGKDRVVADKLLEYTSSEGENQIFSEIENEFGFLLPPSMIELILDWKQDFTDEMILFAVSESVKSNAKNMKYVEAIIERWRTEGVKTLLQAKEKNKKVDKSKAKARGDCSQKPLRNYDQLYEN